MPPAYSFTTTPPADTRTPPNASFANLWNRALRGVDDRHDWWLSGNNLIQKAVDLDNAYGGVLNITSGYRCPAGNKKVGGSINSNHIHGKALDFDQLSNQENWNVWDDALGVAGVVERILYDQCPQPPGGHRILNINQDGSQTNPQWPLPYTGSVVTVGGVDHNHVITDYTHGHVGW